MARLPVPALLVALAAILVVPASARAQGVLEGFVMPSRNVACLAGDTDGGWLRCDMAAMAKVPPRPADCDLDYGHAFEVSGGDRRAGRICHGDTVMGDYPMLAYGTRWQRFGFDCHSEQRGLTCRNRFGRGFFLSRARQDVF